MNESDSQSNLICKIQKQSKLKLTITKLVTSIITSVLLLATTNSITVHAGSMKQNNKKDQEVAALIATADEYTKIANALALVNEKIFVYYETTFLTGDRRQPHFDFSNIRQYAEKTVKAEEETEKNIPNKKDGLELNYIAARERMNARDVVDIMNLIDTANIVIYHTNAMAEVGKTDSKEATKWIAEAAGNGKLLAKAVSIIREELKGLCKNLFADRAKAVIKTLMSNENNHDVKKELANL
jgi:hypothetical protein